MSGMVEKKVDMSLDEILAMRQKQEKAKKAKAAKKKAPPKGGAKATGKKPKPTKQQVAQQSSKLKRQDKFDARRGLGGGKKPTAAQTHKKATKQAAAKTAKVTLRGRGAKPVKKTTPRGAAKSPAKPAASKVPKTFSIEPNAAARPVSIKDFVLPENTKMTISFQAQGKKPATRTAAKKGPVKKATAAKRAPAKKIVIGGKKSPAKGRGPAKKVTPRGRAATGPKKSPGKKKMTVA
eukprot:CAMPEP_0119275294 /NCGR_PEP_ID=MMETSP1329-20130426/13585_1 /TAXON_ID=114041 /ORGANISM="Genus nov. species nov., Strain RCC1024" /LENGTH=235 /DNA_ID=CAMNT_0007275671 /DNA_START=137 /DNA_END=841 /DNA_ORIENTATION=+